MRKNNYPGKFIVFEGLDGSGQTTQANLLRAYLQEEKNLPAILTKEPTAQPPLGTLIRQVLKKEISLSPTAFQFLFCADRSEHLEQVIEPALRQGKWVISDRYFYSTIAFGSLNLDTEWLTALNEPFLAPDMVFLIKTAPKICIDRIDTNRGEREFFEEEEKLTKVWKNYEALAERFPEIHIIDGEKSIEEVFEQIKITAKEI